MIREDCNIWYVATKRLMTRRLTCWLRLSRKTDWLTPWLCCWHTSRCLIFVLRPYDSEEIVRRAKSQVGEQDYNLLSNNCEHFSTWCRNGVKSSKEVAKGFVNFVGHVSTSVLKSSRKDKWAILWRIHYQTSLTRRDKSRHKHSPELTLAQVLCIHLILSATERRNRNV